MRLHVPRRWPGGHETRRRNRVRQRHRGDERLRRLWRLARLRQHRWLCGLEPRRSGGRGARCPRCGHEPFLRHPPRRRVGRERGCAQLPHRADARHAGNANVPRRLRRTRQARHDVRRLALPSADCRGHRPGAGIPRPAHHLRPLRRPAWHRPLRRQAGGDLRPVEAGCGGTRNLRERRRQARRPRHGHQRLRLPQARTPGHLGRTRGRHPRLPPAHDRLLRPRPLHVREQLPGGQGELQLPRAVELVQEDRGRLLRRREGSALHDTAARTYLGG